MPIISVTTRCEHVSTFDLLGPIRRLFPFINSKTSFIASSRIQRFQSRIPRVTISFQLRPRCCISVRQCCLNVNPLHLKDAFRETCTRTQESYSVSSAKGRFCRLRCAIHSAPDERRFVSRQLSYVPSASAPRKYRHCSEPGGRRESSFELGVQSFEFGGEAMGKLTKFRREGNKAVSSWECRVLSWRQRFTVY